jgi:hypothetical protein
MTTSSPEEFVVYLRLLARAGEGTPISGNGSGISLAPATGSFFPIRRESNSADRIEFVKRDRPRPGGRLVANQEEG